MMKTFLKITAIASIGGLSLAGSAHGGLILTGIIDGPLSGGVPKAVELYATTDIADLSTYDLQNFNNGGATANNTFALSGSVSAGEHFYVASESTGFAEYFGFSPDFTSSAVNVNGDDVVALRQNGTIIDQYGVIGTDGSGQSWDYLDSYAYRIDGTGPSGTFDVSEWSVAPINTLDGTTSATGLPFGTYQIPEPSTALAAAGVLGLALRRRRA